MTEHTGSEDAGTVVRGIGPADLDWLLALNNASVPHVNHLEPDDLAQILQFSSYARCINQDGRPAGALVALAPGTDYRSAHYRWFGERYADFLYVDRVMIDRSAHKSGLGRRLYADLEAFARLRGASHLACEVNSEPPNPVSMAFHAALGFCAVGELASGDRSKRVVLMMKPVASAGG
ncbi:MAG: GNAT family N-acetyltransferase [Alphaproteobacteria bacterium]